MKKSLFLLAIAALSFNVLAADAPASAARPAGAPAGAPNGMAPQFPIARADFLKRAGDEFDTIDANHDGKVTLEEMQAFRQKMMDAMRAQQKPLGQAPAGKP